MKKRTITLGVALLLALALLAGCSGTPATSSAAPAASSAAPAASTAAAATSQAPETPGEVESQYPYNLQPEKYDSRADKYLYGINATKLPLVKEGDKEVVVDVWKSFNSTVIQSFSDSLVFQEMERRTGVKINFIYPPVGQATENYNLSISSLDLPHMYSCPPMYTGGLDKAVDDGIYMELTPYYEKGLLPNYKYLLDTYDGFAKDAFMDSGRMIFLPMIDMIGSAPWSGMWVRKDWLDELGLQIPETIEEYDAVLRAFKESKSAVLGLNLNINKNNSWGTWNNYMISTAYDTSLNWFNKDGTVVFGPLEPGFEPFITQLNAWYKDGLIDPDFTTRMQDTGDSYNANVANGVYGMWGMNYGEIGQAIVSGRAKEPAYKITPLKAAKLTKDQVVHLHQNNATVRGDKDVFTTRCVDDGIDEIIMQWKDYWYSQEGGDLCSYGVVGESYEWGDDGEFHWIYPELVTNKEADFWTLYPKFKLHNWGYLRNSLAYDMQPEVYECIEVWGSEPNAWIMPDSIAYTDAESREIALNEADIKTYVEENVFRFVTGQRPLSEIRAFQDGLKSMNIERICEIRTDAVKRYMSR